MRQTFLHRRDFLAASAATLALPGASLRAQTGWPSKPVKGINPFQAGGPSDFLGRLIGDKLAQRLGQSFVMENRPRCGRQSRHRRPRQGCAGRPHPGLGGGLQHHRQSGAVSEDAV